MRGGREAWSESSVNAKDFTVSGMCSAWAPLRVIFSTFGGKAIESTDPFKVKFTIDWGRFSIARVICLLDCWILKVWREDGRDLMGC